MSLNVLSPKFKSMFREYDIRGRVNEDELNKESVYHIISAYAHFLSEMNVKSSIVGYDNRDCSPEFAEATINALIDRGINVYYIGLSISPLAYYAQYLYSCEGAVMITASHNPNGWSGFKLAKGFSKTLEADDVKKMYDLVLNLPNSPSIIAKGTISTVNARDNYINEIISRIKMGPKKPKVVIDAGNGGAGLFAYELFQKLGCITFQLNCDPDTTYPHYFPNPSNIQSRERLRNMIIHPYIKADIGVGFDGDGDRIGVIDEAGNDIYSDIILAVLAKQLLEKKSKAKIVYDVKCSKTLEEVIIANDGVPVMWITGHSYIKSKMHNIKAELAGERSGHIFYGGDDYYGFDDAVFTAAKLLEYLSHLDKPLSEIVSEFPKYLTSPEIKAHCDDLVKYDIVSSIISDLKAQFPGKVNDICGARVEFDDGWGLIRASSNLPELVIIFEAKTKSRLLEIREILKTVVKKYPEISEWENDIYE